MKIVLSVLITCLVLMTSYLVADAKPKKWSSLVVWSGSSLVVESLSLMREAWVQSSAAPTKALEQGLNLYLLLRPYLDGAPACLNRINFCKTWSYVGGFHCAPPFDRLSIKFIIIIILFLGP